MRIEIHYEERISFIEFATLPVLIQELEAIHTGCTLRLESVQTAVGGATVALVIDDIGERDPKERDRLKTEIETLAQRVSFYQRAFFEEREKIDHLIEKQDRNHSQHFSQFIQFLEYARENIMTNIKVSGGQVGTITIGDGNTTKAITNYT
jgi:hypothetical protein